ncbi:hypothetical protein AAZX31_03G158200 [Glycine max]|uniref:Transmembrane protein n=2 Tax=Glycine subgen. Soja TaxID=1462606 RepID=I1JPI5_SOYBN|nr:uncharacterized protein LOC100819096 [Glycine max]XP_028225780.1 uncharacterized protein LOC114407049 [Glycine soja]KAG5043727.1 hypothetical protein JHK87_007642 [Glycine soja]KAG5055514.1 hypothetical protein JHK85_008024 [Glycine max]KAG5072579.1 hypothetical protein JHK86_007790 [Glycine max]KAH1070548.1 hypothetical protein GYH30_007561 [Glycine max]KAH1258572.1 hypothetical protein GmHk_03G008270 [Glycine max]|eukprot:XP_003521370.1 uncharacterized protein LOC100819096 [Glycine max]
MQMDIVYTPSFISHRFSSSRHQCPSLSSSYSPFKLFCSNRDFKESQRNDDNNNKGDKSSTDWDKAWSKFKKQGGKKPFSKFSDKYVSWNPRRSEFPLSEEVDPIKRTERSNLSFWNSPTFTLGGAIIIVTFLLLYTILAPIK